MRERETNRVSVDRSSDNGASDHVTQVAVYCATCGTRPPPDRPPVERFGEAFCSDAHAEAFARDVRAARVQAAVMRAGGEPAVSDAGAAGRPGWTARLGKALCWGGPALALVALGVLALGGGGMLFGAAAAALPLLAVLACPVGMYLMMRSMSRTGHGDGGQRNDHDQR